MIEFILYVKNQKLSSEFYSKLLLLEPILDEPGMTQFSISDGARLGLMPEDGIYKLLEQKVKHPSLANGAPRCEIYLRVERPEDYIERCANIGGKIIDLPRLRDWGDIAGYCEDLDGHILAFAK